MTIELEVKICDREIRQLLKKNDDDPIEINGSLSEVVKHGGKPYSLNIMVISLLGCIALGGLLNIFFSGIISLSVWVIVAISCIFILYMYFYLNKPKIVVTYSIDDRLYQRYEECCKHFELVARSDKVWRISGHKKNMDLKYSAGASASVGRSSVGAGYSSPFFLEVKNLNIPKLDKFYFLPDRILVRSIFSGEYKEYPYTKFYSDDLDLEFQPTTKFVEKDAMPKDATVIGKTWAYVNKSGGPDKRFKNNKKIPICRYRRISFTLDGKTYEYWISKEKPESYFSQALGEVEKYFSINPKFL